MGLLASVCHYSRTLTLAGAFETGPVKIAQSCIGLGDNPQAEVAINLPAAENADTVELAHLARQ